ncbi:MAG: DUF2461 family protein [Acidobacteria bacterium]|nr:DUF2461 family protein [Acidobacteriota bacterium]
MKTFAPPHFAGFHPEAFRFFRRLAHNNHKPWFDRHRTLYAQHVAGALKGLFEELAPRMLGLDPDFEVSAKTGRNFSRINRDIRFARDKSPYRRNLYLYFTPRQDPEAATRLYVGLSAEGITWGFAVYDGRSSALERLLKARRAQNPAALNRFIRRLARRFEMYWHGTERGEWKKYRGAPRTEKDWKRCRAWVVRKKFGPGRRELRSPRFATTVARVFRELYPLYAFATVKGRRGERALAEVQ